MKQLLKQPNSVGIIPQETINKLSNVSSKELSIYNNNISLVKFKDYETDKELALVTSLLIRWSNYLGIEAPESIELNTICNFLKEHFPNINHEDLNNTINMVVKDELNIDVEHYGKLSLIYINKCIKSYLDYKGSVIIKIRQKIEKLESEKSSIVSPESRLENFKTLVCYAKKDVSNNIVFQDFGDAIYNFIKKNKLMLMNKEIVEQAMDYGNSKFIEEKKQKSIESTFKKNFLKTTSDLNFEKEDRIKKFAREYVVNLWLKKIDLQDFLEKINITML